MEGKLLLELQEYLSNMRNQVSQGAYFHYGDLMWRMNFLKNEFDESKHFRVWRHDNSIIGFVFDLAKENNPEIFIKPELYNSVYANEMLAYAITCAKNRNVNYIETSCLKSDRVKEAYLLSKGFKKQNDVMVIMENLMTDSFENTKLPFNYTLVLAETCDKYDNALSWLTNQQFGKLLNTTNSDNCLSSIVCYKKMDIVSGHLCWYDAVANIGSFEPVETCSDHQKKGLAFMGMQSSLLKLKNRGATKAYVKTGFENTAAISLYKKLGFNIIDLDYGWQLEV